MDASSREKTDRRLHMVERDELVLVASVVVGGVGAALTHPLLANLFEPETARNAGLAIATTLTSSTHARLAHRHPFRSLVPISLASAPLVYALMRTVHLLAGS